MRKKLSAAIIALVTVAFVPQAHAAGPDHVDITWMSIANIHYQMGSFGVLTDGYITRIPEREFHGGGGGYAYTNKPWEPDVSAVTRGLDAIGGADKNKFLLPRPSHCGHFFYTPHR